MLRAARWRGYTWEAFDALESDQQALVIAEYRIEARYQAVDAWEHRPKPGKPKTPQGGRTRGRRRR